MACLLEYDVLSILDPYLLCVWQEPGSGDWFRFQQNGYGSRPWYPGEPWTLLVNGCPTKIGMIHPQVFEFAVRFQSSDIQTRGTLRSPHGIPHCAMVKSWIWLINWRGCSHHHRTQFILCFFTFLISGQSRRSGQRCRPWLLAAIAAIFGSRKSTPNSDALQLAKFTARLW